MKKIIIISVVLIISLLGIFFYKNYTPKEQISDLDLYYGETIEDISAKYPVVQDDDKYKILKDITIADCKADKEIYATFTNNKLSSICIFFSAENNLDDTSAKFSKIYYYAMDKFGTPTEKYQDYTIAQYTWEKDNNSIILSFRNNVATLMFYNNKLSN